MVLFARLPFSAPIFDPHPFRCLVLATATSLRRPLRGGSLRSARGDQRGRAPLLADHALGLRGGRERHGDLHPAHAPGEPCGMRGSDFELSGAWV